MSILLDARATPGVACVAILCLGLLSASVSAQVSGEPVKTTLCEIAAHPETFEGKLVQVRAIVDPGVDDLPAGVTDDRCGATAKFFMPGDRDFARLVKSKEFRKLIKDVKKYPVVEATVTGWFKPASGLMLQSVQNVAPRPPAKRA